MRFATNATLGDILLGQRRREIIEAQLGGNCDVVPYCKGCPDWSELLNYVKPKEASTL